MWLCLEFRKDIFCSLGFPFFISATVHIAPVTTEKKNNANRTVRFSKVTVCLSMDAVAKNIRALYRDWWIDSQPFLSQVIIFLQLKALEVLNLYSALIKLAGVWSEALKRRWKIKRDRMQRKAMKMLRVLGNTKDGWMQDSVPIFTWHEVDLLELGLGQRTECLEPVASTVGD